MWEFFDALEGLGCLIEAVCAVFRGVAALVRWIASPFRRVRGLPPGESPKSIEFGGRKRR